MTSSTDGPDTPNSSSPDSLTENVEMERSDPESGLHSAEYTQQYGRIVCGEQRSRYKEDFNSQYDEYRDLFQSIDKVSKRFAKLEEELRQQHEGTIARQVNTHPCHIYQHLPPIEFLSSLVFYLFIFLSQCWLFFCVSLSLLFVPFMIRYVELMFTYIYSCVYVFISF